MKRRFQLAFWWLVVKACDALLALTERAAGEPAPSAPVIRIAAATCGCAYCRAEVVFDRECQDAASMQVLASISLRTNPGARA